MMDDVEKPPLGLRPREIADEEFREARAVEIIAAMQRYDAAGRTLDIPPEWAYELAQLIVDHNRKKQEQK